jgi:TolA-binding protein
MRRGLSWLLAGGLCCTLIAVQQSYSDDAPRRAVLSQAVAFQEASSDGEKQATPKRRAARGRLPNFYGQVGVSTSQRNSIYEIQSKYREQLEELEKQIVALREKQEQEMEAVLTPEQKKTLHELREAAEQRRAARRAEGATQRRQPDAEPESKPDDNDN